MLSALLEQSWQLLVWGRGGVYREDTRGSGWQDRRLSEWELTDLSQTKAGICAVSHDRNMCFLVKGWRRVHGSLGRNRKSHFPKMGRDKISGSYLGSLKSMTDV